MQRENVKSCVQHTIIILYSEIFHSIPLVREHHRHKISSVFHRKLPRLSLSALQSGWSATCIYTMSCTHVYTGTMTFCDMRGSGKRREGEWQRDLLCTTYKPNVANTKCKHGFNTIILYYSVFTPGYTAHVHIQHFKGSVLQLASNLYDG